MNVSRFALAILATLHFAIEQCTAQAAFTYQGRVTANGTNFNGLGQFKFALVTSTNTSRTATAMANMGGVPPNQFVGSCTVTFGGSGYVTAPSVNISGGGGSGATAQANLTGGAVSSITVLTPGSGYSSAPTVTIAPPPPTFFYTNYWSNDGTSVNGSEPLAAVSAPVSNGLFTVALGDTTLPNMAAINSTIFAQPNLQLRIWFSDGVGGFVALSPLQNLTPSPYAINSGSANSLLGTLSASQLTGSIPASQIGGTLTAAQLPASLLTNNQGGVNLGGAFSGNGAGLTNVSIYSLSLIGSSTNRIVVSWGFDGSGLAAPPLGLNNAAAVAVGNAHTVVLKSDGTVVAWGYNGSGQTNVPAGLTNVIAVAAGSYHSVALRSNGTVVVWGDNLNGQTNVPAGLSNVLAVVAGGNHNLALKNNGTVVGWGANNWGQTNIPIGLSNVVTIAAGGAHNVVVKNDGTVLAWGYPAATNVPPGLSNVVALAAGDGHTLALRNDGTVIAWGNNSSGQTNVPAGLSSVVMVAAGSFHSLALKSDGSVVAWGYNYYGQTNIPAGLRDVAALGTGCGSYHVSVVQNQSALPTEWPEILNGFLSMNGYLSVNGRLTVYGPSILNGPATVNGLSTVNGPSTLNGNSTVFGILNVNGDSFASGNMGIGTSFAGAKLDVRGSIKLGNSGEFYAPGATENLRVVRGVLSGAGGVLVGSGFTVSHPSGGVYTVTFNPSFTSSPTVTANVESGAGAARLVTLQNVTANSATFNIVVPNTLAVADAAFHFTAMGGR
jgi:hypothetical protein